MRFLAMLVFLLSGGPLLAVDDSVRQLVVGIAPDWDSSQGKMQRFERDGQGSWRPVAPAVPVLFGSKGLAWGRGVWGQEEAGRHKRERDKRAPAGVFKIGKIYGYDESLPAGSDYPYHQVGEGDAWVDDPASPHYNLHVVVDPASPPSWFEKQKMRHGDFAYHWLVEIRHNADPPVPDAGSAIFFHIRRGATRTSAGCTTMKRSDLEEMIRWLRDGKRPHYVLLPWAEYQQRWKAWGLPEPQGMAELRP